MDKMQDMILEAVQMNGIENVVMPLMNEIFLSFTLQEHVIAIIKMYLKG